MQLNLRHSKRCLRQLLYGAKEVGMETGETVTFGGSGRNGSIPLLDRAAHLRAGMEQAHLDGRITPLWRGKIAVQNGAQLAWFDRNHPVLASGKAPIFLGLISGQPHFGVDVSDWIPDAALPEAGFFDTNPQPHPDMPSDTAFCDLRAVMSLLSPLDGECAAVAKALMQWHKSHGFCPACGAKTDVSHGGWQRVCTACDATHFPRTDPVVIMLVVHENKLLLGRSPQWPEGMYSLLAGFIEPGEIIEAAVRREVFEEAGIRIGAVRYLASQPWVFPASLMLGCLAQATSQAITLDTQELQDALWVTREEMVAIQSGVHPQIKSGRPGAIAQFLIESWLADRLD